MVSKRSRRFRGTMVVKPVVNSMKPIIVSPEERFAKRKSSKKGKRRLSTGNVPNSPKKDPTVYQVLINLVFAIAGFRPMYAQNAIDTLFSMTSTNKRNLTVKDKYMLEEAFNVLYHEIDHIFIPWITQPNLKGRASNYLDIPFLIDSVLSLERNSLSPIMPKSERNDLQAPVQQFLNVVGATRRFTL
jgi:hypothetical protein